MGMQNRVSGILSIVQWRGTSISAEQMKRKITPQRPRPDVYTQALNAAKKRLDAALIEKENHQSLLAILDQEIPWLQRIIDALEPRPMIDTIKSHEHNEKAIEMSWVGKPKPRVKPSAEALKHVPDHLKRFVQPVEEPQIPVNGSVEDQFLPDVE